MTRTALIATVLAGALWAHAAGWRVENATLAVEIRTNDAALIVTDRRTGRTWHPAPEAPCALRNVQLVTSSPTALELAATATISNLPVRVRLALDPTASAEFTVTLSGEGDFPGKASIPYPPALDFKPGDHLIVPFSEGFRLPLGQPTLCFYTSLNMYASSCCMPFFGAEREGDGAGWQIIAETPNDAAVVLHRGKPEGTRMGEVAPLLAAGMKWLPELGRFGYPRVTRYVLHARGGYVAMAKRYRAAARREGLVKTFREKVKERPLVDRLLGAPNVWYSRAKDDPSRLEMARELHAAGIDRFLWSAGGYPDEVKGIGALTNVLVSRYVCLRDIYHPEMLAALGRKPGLYSNTSAWPDDVIWKSPLTNDYRNAWDVKDKTGRRWFCGAQCTSRQIPHAREIFAKDMRTHPFTGRFLDVTGGAFEDCWNPAHRMTRTQGRAAQFDLLGVVSRELGLVCGSEQGMGCIVPVCDYFEGMLSPWGHRTPYRLSDRQIPRSEIFRDGLHPTNVPPAALARVTDFSLNPRYRIPLFELVFHDCCCSHWYWYDYSNRPLFLWPRRDLFSALYATAPMYVFDHRHWLEHKAEFLASYRWLGPLVRRLGYEEMTDHRVLTSDRLVQRTTFADGTTVTANFGERPYALPDGGVLAPMASVMRPAERDVP